MLENDYLELCNQLKEKFDEQEHKEETYKKKIKDLSTTVLSFSSLIQALSIEFNALELEYTGNCGALLDILLQKSSHEIEDMLKVTTAHILVGFNLPDEEEELEVD